MNESIKDDKWLKIEEMYGAEVKNAMMALHGYYDGAKIAEWIVSLYDAKTGGFYYCKSARDTDGYGPDLESTSQALTVLAEMGAVPTAEINEILPQSIRKKIIKFVQDKQSSFDGYFYHPQWPYGKENLNTDRYGRDLDNAASILRRVTCDLDGDGVDEKQYPRYCTPGGVKCARHSNTDEFCKFPIDYVAEKVPVAKEKKEEDNANADKNPSSLSMHPVYTDKDSFLGWLREYDASIHENSGRAHNLAALSDEIIMHGYGDTLIDYLDEMQKQLFDEQVNLGENPTGVWQRSIDYRAVWGMYKHLYIYNKIGRPVNLEYVPYMVKTCLEVIKLPPIKNYAYNDLMNQWSAITALKYNVKIHYGDAEAEKITAIVRGNALSLIENSLEKMLPFKMEDASFCNSVHGYSTPIIYGVPIAVGGIAEGNVNSTHILLCMYASICNALGCPIVPLCDRSVGVKVAELLADKELSYKAL